MSRWKRSEVYGDGGAAMKGRGSIENLELLAPAGGMEQLEYAVRFGADAVYLACDRFGLRQRAENFSLSGVPDAVAFAHAHHVRVYVTCNAYMNAEDLTLLPPYFETLAAAQVDAFIVSDLGALRLARRHAPQVALHVSTQAACTNAQAALAWYELGARRIVCAREMSLGDIKAMRAAVPDDLELEAFVQGAMCMAISGRCLISDYLTGRPANRGHCTQPCRWQYSLHEPTRPGQDFPIEEDGRGTYIMNSKDLCMLAHLDDLAAAGVDSIKIEGRNKKAFYVATMVNAYRQVLDGADPALFLPELDTVSHRPYSTGFFYGNAEQTDDADAYLQSYDWVAEVRDVCESPGEPERREAREGSDSPEGAKACENHEGCQGCEDPGSPEGRVHVTCRNRFYEGDRLEVLSPHRALQVVRVRDLRLEFAGGASAPAEVANRAMDHYSFAADVPLFPYDILRVKRIDPHHKN